MITKIEQLLLVVVAWLARFVYLVYKLFMWPVVLVPLGIWYWHSHRDQVAAVWSWLVAHLFHGGALLAGLVLLALYCLYRLYTYDSNLLPAATSANALLDRLSSRFIAWIGTLKYFNSPLCIVEDPGSYKIKGPDVRKLTDSENGLLQAGDILLRGYDGYVDGLMIGASGASKGSSKFFSHAALYVGKLNDTSDRTRVAQALRVLDPDGSWRDADPLEKEKIRNDPGYFSAGPQMVIHSMTKGVHVEDILSFVRCDYLAVLRLRDPVRLGKGHGGATPLTPLSQTTEQIDNAAAQEIDARLLRGEPVSRAQVVESVRTAAFEKIGSGYDFLFDDGSHFHRFSCSEFVYYCFKSVHRVIGLSLKKHAFAGIFFARNTITPADLYEAAHPGGPLEVVWEKISGTPS